MNVLDIVIIVILAAVFLIGWRLRAIQLLAMATSLVAGVVLASRFSSLLFEHLPQMPATMGKVIAWLTIFLITVIAVSLLGSLLSKLVEWIRLQWLDQLIGATLASALMLSLLTIGLTLVDLGARTYHWTLLDRSHLSMCLLRWSRPLIRENWDRLKPPILHRQSPI